MSPSEMDALRLDGLRRFMESYAPAGATADDGFELRRLTTANRWNERIQAMGGAPQGSARKAEA